MDAQYFQERRERAHTLYIAHKTIHCAYFHESVTLNADGFHHLQFSARRERDKKEQLLKLSLLPLAFEIIHKSGTVQEYRKLLAPIGKTSRRDGSVSMKTVQYWGLVAIVGEKQIKVRTVLRKVGDGNITFWSVMPYSKIKNGQQKLHSEGIEDE